jgi:hypothetical protein
VAGPKTLDAVQKAAHPPQASLADASHPGNAIYKQALEGVKAIDAQHGRKPDHLSDNLAASLATAARAANLSKVDHVVMSDDGKRAYAMQGEQSSPFKRVAEVDVAQSVAKPIEQSSAEFQKVEKQQAVPPQTQTQQAQQAQQPPQHQAPQQSPGLHP